MRPGYDARGAAPRGGGKERRRARVLPALVAAAWALSGAVGLAQEPPGELRLAASPAPWRHTVFPSATACAGEIFVAAQSVYASRDGRRWRQAGRGLPRRHHASGVECVEGTAFVFGYPALIARWDPESRAWQVEHAASVEDRGRIRYWPVEPYIGSMIRERTGDGWRLRGRGMERINEAMDLVRRPDGSWERVAPRTDWASVLPRHCEVGRGPGVSMEGAVELCGDLPHRLFLWRSPVTMGAPWPAPEEILFPPPPANSGYWGAGWSPSTTLVVGPVLTEHEGSADDEHLVYDTDRPSIDQVVTLHHQGAWRRAIVRGYSVTGPVELGSSIFLFTTHRVYRVIEPRSGRQREAPRR